MTLDFTTWVLQAVTCACLAGGFAARTGVPVRPWFGLGALLGPLGLLLLLLHLRTPLPRPTDAPVPPAA